MVKLEKKKENKWNELLDLAKRWIRARLGETENGEIPKVTPQPGPAYSQIGKVAFRRGPLPRLPHHLPPFSRNTGTGGGMWCGPRPDASTPVVPYQLLRNLHSLGSFPSLLSLHLFSTLKQRFQFQILWANMHRRVVRRRVWRQSWNPSHRSKSSPCLHQDLTELLYRTSREC